MRLCFRLPAGTSDSVGMIAVVVFKGCSAALPPCFSGFIMTFAPYIKSAWCCIDLCLIGVPNFVNKVSLIFKEKPLVVFVGSLGFTLQLHGRVSAALAGQIR